jgi:hypothetical protein
MDAEVFRHEPIGRAAPRENPHEGQVGHILHRRKDKGGAGGWEEVTHRRG